MTLEEVSNYWWYKIKNTKNSVDYVPYKSESREEANKKIAHDMINKSSLWPYYFSTNKTYRRHVVDIVSYKPCSWREVEFVYKEKLK